MHAAKQRPVIFTPADPRYRRRLWLSVDTPHGPRLFVYWWRVLPLLVLAATLMWFGGAAALCVWLRARHPGADISCVNVAWPPRWAQHRTALGRAHLAAGRQAFARRNPVAAARFLAAGLARLPDDLPARTLLASLQLAGGQGALAVTTLGRGLPVAIARDDLDFVKLAFRARFAAKDFSGALATARLLLPAVPDARPAHQLIARLAAAACLELGDYRGAADWLERWRLSQTAEGQVLLARADEKQGRPDAALSRLARTQLDFPERLELAIELIRLNRATGHFDAALRQAQVRARAAPFAPGARIDLCRAWRELGDPVRERNATAAYLRDFRRSPAALILLARYAADTAQPELAHEVDRATAALPADARLPFRVAVVQAHLRARRYSDALDLLDALATASASPKSLHGWRAVACRGLGRCDTAAAEMRAQLAAAPLPPEDAQSLAHLLVDAGAPDLANLITASQAPAPSAIASFAESTAGFGTP